MFEGVIDWYDVAYVGGNNIESIEVLADIYMPNL